MLDPSLHARMAESCTEAMTGYTRAATAAYAAAVGQSLDMWTRALRQSSETLHTASSPGVGRPYTDTTSWPFWPNPWTAWTTPTPLTNPFELWAAWASMNPWRANPSVWPMTVMMMSYGVPREVAVPTAEANAAVLDAADAAKQSMEQAFSSYRSDGGHATAQVIFQKFAAALIAGPLGLATLPTWFTSNRPF